MKRRPKPKPGRIELYWHEPSGQFMVNWGDGCDKRDATLFFDVLDLPLYPYSFVNGMRDGERTENDKETLVSTLRERGYDLTTLRIGVEKRKEDG